LEKTVQGRCWRLLALNGEGSAPTGVSLTVQAPLTGAASLLSPRRQPRGGVGSQPARLAHAQLQQYNTPKYF